MTGVKYLEGIEGILKLCSLILETVELLGEGEFLKLPWAPIKCLKVAVLDLSRPLKLVLLVSYWPGPGLTTCVFYNLGID